MALRIGSRCRVGRWPGWQPREISERCRDVYRVLWDLGPQSCGKTERYGYARAVARAREFAEQ